MLTPLVVLGKVGAVCGIGFIVSTGFEWVSDLEIKPKNKIIKLGSEKEKGGENNDESKIESLSKKARQ